VGLLSLASPIQEPLFDQGCKEVIRLGYVPQFDRETVLAQSSFFAGSTDLRAKALRQAITDPAARAIFCTRGGYGSNYLIEALSETSVNKGLAAAPKILLGCSDITSLQLFLWQQHNWVTFYGPMVATNFSRGAGQPHGYDCSSLIRALTETQSGWRIDLHGEPLHASTAGTAEGPLLGGCLTLIECALGTSWDLDTEGAILLLEDRGMKPYQVDRALMHLKQAGKLRGLAAIILGEFPECEAPPKGETIRDIAQRLFAPLGIPIAWGAPVGHTERPMLTIPLGVRARLVASGGASTPSPYLEILEPACSA